MERQMIDRVKEFQVEIGNIPSFIEVLQNIVKDYPTAKLDSIFSQDDDDIVAEDFGIQIIWQELETDEEIQQRKDRELKTKQRLIEELSKSQSYHEVQLKAIKTKLEEYGK